jgi:hypothetical protein
LVLIENSNDFDSLTKALIKLLKLIFESEPSFWNIEIINSLDRLLKIQKSPFDEKQVISKVKKFIKEEMEECPFNDV